jgi:hypothetical protein
MPTVINRDVLNALLRPEHNEFIEELRLKEEQHVRDGGTSALEAVRRPMRILEKHFSKFETDELQFDYVWMAHYLRIHGVASCLLP